MNHRPGARILRQTGMFAVLLMLCFGIGVVGCGGGGGSSATVTAPTITAQPTSQTASVETTVSMGVAASGSGLSYQWYKDTVAISGATGATYSITGAATTDSGTYYVIVTNSAGSVQSNSVTLTVSATTGSGTVTVQ